MRVICTGVASEVNSPTSTRASLSAERLYMPLNESRDDSPRSVLRFVSPPQRTLWLLRRPDEAVDLDRRSPAVVPRSARARTWPSLMSVPDEYEPEKR